MDNKFIDRLIRKNILNFKKSIMFTDKNIDNYIVNQNEYIIVMKSSVFFLRLVEFEKVFEINRISYILHFKNDETIGTKYIRNEDEFYENVDVYKRINRI